MSLHYIYMCSNSKYKERKYQTCDTCENCILTTSSVFVRKMSNKTQTHIHGTEWGAFVVARWNVIIALTSWPRACFFFGLVRLGRNADGLHIQLRPWLETQSRIHNQNPWQDVPLLLRKEGGEEKKTVERVCLLNVVPSISEQFTLPSLG